MPPFPVSGNYQDPPSVQDTCWWNFPNIYKLTIFRNCDKYIKIFKDTQRDNLKRKNMTSVAAKIFFTLKRDQTRIKYKDVKEKYDKYMFEKSKRIERLRNICT